MAEHVCPWWVGFFIDNPIRRILHNPEQIVNPYVKSGMTVMDVGCGMGLFTIAMAKIVGDRGLVIAIDLQPKMLYVLQKRADKAGVADHIHPHRCEADKLGLFDYQVDFALAFAMLHEVPNKRSLLEQIHGCLKSEGKFLIAEPRLHVSGRTFDEMATIAESIGLRLFQRPTVRLCRAALFEKKG